MASAFSFRAILDKMDNSDSDYRYMATSDLLTQLQTNSLRIDPDAQKRLCKALLKLLKDTNTEVQAMATKCLPYLTLSVHPKNAAYILEKLLDHLLDLPTAKTKSSSSDSLRAMRDVSSLALKSVLNQLSPTMPNAPALISLIVPRLLPPLSSLDSVAHAADVLIEVLELLYEMLTRMAPLCTQYHSRASSALFHQMHSKNPLVTKRTIACIGALSACCQQDLFVAIVDTVLRDLQQPGDTHSIRTGVHTIRALSKSCGHRLGAYVQVVAPILFDYAALDRGADDEQDDLRENCLLALESFCLRCRREMIPFAETLSKCVLQLAEYDPNYVDDERDEDAEEGMQEDGDDLQDDFGDDDDDYSDDDDTSWKVRRAAIKCLHAAITSQLSPASELCSTFGPFLVSRFREREEQVKLDVFSAFIDLLRLCSSQAAPTVTTSQSQLTPSPLAVDPMSVDSSNETRAELAPLYDEAPRIIRRIQTELGSRSAKVRIKAMKVTREIVAAMPSLTASLVAKVIKEVDQGLADTGTAMKTEALLFLREVIESGAVEALKEHIQLIITRILSGTNDRYYKVTAECMRFGSSALVAFGRSSPECKAMMSPLAAHIYDAAMRRATAQDQDSEVKEAAIHCLGSAVSQFGSDLGAQRLEEVATVMCDRLRIDVTRLSTVRALGVIALSESAGILSAKMPEIVSTLSSFLRKNNQILRVAALEFLCIVPTLPTDNDADLIANLSGLISDVDLTVTYLALKLTSNIVKSRGVQILPRISASESIYPKAIALSTSLLLQGRAIEGLLTFLRSLAELEAEPLRIQVMLEDLKKQITIASLNATGSSVPASSIYCVAKCVVAICDAADAQLRARIAQDIVSNVNSDEIQTKVLSLACLGEFGRGSTLLHDAGEKELIKNALLTALDSTHEEVRTTAALALGAICSADGSSGLPALLSHLNERPHQQYLLLCSLKQAISSSKQTDIVPLTKKLISVLLQQPTTFVKGNGAHLSQTESRSTTSSEEESVRTATAECLALLAHASPQDVLKSMKEASKSPSRDVRAVVAAAIKFAVTSSASNNLLFGHLRSNMDAFIVLIGDSEVIVAKNALQAINAIAKSRPQLLAPHLETILPLVYSRTVKDKDLVRVVDLGPFKHEEDYGLDIRKSAFDCLRTFLSGSLHLRIPFIGMLDQVMRGLRDHADVRSIAQLILTTAATTEAAPQMVEIMDVIVRELGATFNERLKDNAVRQEIERHEESIRGAMRAVRMMENVAEIRADQRFQMLLTNVVQRNFAEKYESIGKSEIEMMTFGSVSRSRTDDSSRAAMHQQHIYL
ncbi:Cullin-associated NEDD8-dissociated protein 1 [Gracilariopsis chorda]|uniref:Cullin-associated NEDD8-dissociated protein 1 n=1 Tax=Gracilariopsis chorda TaxID=448386 RepID=A0A2V3J4X1_9FLOR|nr:Cullin-associated NEDD8-dissociated protein 1 [Gracilariopsis chorda]|eukprot:PXF49481.1 Cullin-associated NEDD8-dissociated protein 1 [Gracilariopsis chorda]